MLSLCPFDISAGVGAFVIGLSQISSFFSNKDTSWPRGTLEIVIQKVVWLIRGSYSAIWSIPLTNVKWHSDPWPTVTSQPIRLSTNFMTLIPILNLADYEWFPWSICNRCGIPAGDAYPSGHLVPSHHCGICLCSNCWDQIPRTCHVFTRLFTSNTPWYFLDFAPYLIVCQCLNNDRCCSSQENLRTTQRRNFIFLLSTLITLKRWKMTGRVIFQYGQFPMLQWR